MKKLSIYFFVLLCLNVALYGDTSKDLFERATYHEETSGDLIKAIELYRRCQTLSEKQPALAAKALYHQAHCYLKSGDLNKANELFSQLLKKYPQQQTITTQVLKHLVMPDTPIKKKSREYHLLEKNIPKFKCTGVSLVETIELLRQRSKQLDPQKYGLNMIYLSGDNDETKFSFDFENMPLGECIRYISLATNTKYKFDGQVIILADSDTVFDDIVSNSYYMSSGLVKLITESKDEEKDFSEKLKKYFQAMGISFPTGSLLYYSVAINRLFMCNTKEEQQRVSEILTQLNIDKDQLKVRAQLIEIDDNTSLKALPEGSLSYKDLMQIPAKGRRTIASLSCFTKNGRTCFVRDVELYEVINDKGVKEMNEFGTILEFTEQLDPDGFSIELEYRGTFSEMVNGVLKDVIVDTRFKIYDGAGMLIQVQDKGSEKENKRNLYLYVQADLINTKGRKKN